MKWWRSPRYHRTLAVLRLAPPVQGDHRWRFCLRIHLEIPGYAPLLSWAALCRLLLKNSVFVVTLLRSCRQFGYLLFRSLFTLWWCSFRILVCLCNCRSWIFRRIYFWLQQYRNLHRTRPADSTLLYSLLEALIWWSWGSCTGKYWKVPETTRTRSCPKNQRLSLSSWPQ